MPELARDLALDNLSNRIAYADDFQNGGEDIAYALYVLARSRPGLARRPSLLRRDQARQLRHARSPRRRSAPRSPSMATGAARPTAFQAAFADLAGRPRPDDWRGDYGSGLRDKAAVLTLAAENNIEARRSPRPGRPGRARPRKQRRYTSTQENAWMLLAAAALIKDATRTSFEIEGAAVAGPLYKEYTQATDRSRAGRDHQPRHRRRSTRSSPRPA